MDLSRYHLIQNREGLPLGMLAVKPLFTDATFILSPEFRHGILGFAGWKKKVFVAFIVMFCSSLALLAGPSAALLLIPNSYTDWPAGGAYFSLVGSPNSIWLDDLDIDAIGGAHCRDPSMNTLQCKR